MHYTARTRGMQQYWDEVEHVFAQGVHCSQDARSDLLRNVEGDIAAQVRQLWEHFDRAGSFLDAVQPMPAAPRRAGEMVGNRFRLLRLLGAGGMGEVFSARDESLRRVVALKFLNAELAARADGRRQLEREAQAVCGLAHPHICTLFDLSWDGSTPFLVMEHLEGETLADRLRRGPMPWQEVTTVAHQMVDALEHAHQAGVVHRDFKPGNVMLTPRGVKIVDFGIAKQVTSAPGSEHSDAAGSIAAILGTVSYMSPEQAQGRPIDQRSDIFSFGCVLYEMLTATRAFSGPSPVATLAAVLQGEPAPADTLMPGIPEPLLGVVRRCLRKSREERFASLADVRLVLEELASGRPAARSGTNTRRPPGMAAGLLRGKRKLATSAAAAILLSSAGVVLLDRASVPVEARDSIAVLPFANVQQDAALEYMADGLAESITNSLSRFEAVRVVARSTAFGYKGRQPDLRELGKQLGVRALVTGRVSRSGDQLRVQADLVDAGAGTQLWGKQYQGTSDDLLAIHGDIVSNVSERLHVELADAATTIRASTGVPQAYELYLKGRYALSRSTVRDIQNGITLFQQALRLDPSYALAYAGLADSYLGLSGMYLTPRDAMAKAKAAAHRASELDPGLVDARVSRGVILAFHDFAWRDAEEEFRAAVDLRPDDPAVRLWYAWALLLTGRTDAGIRQALTAHELEPLSAFIETGLGQMYYLSGQHTAAIQRLRSLVAADPNFFNGHYYLGVAYLFTGQYGDAARELEQAHRLDPQQPQPLGYLAYALAKGGDVEAARAQLAALVKLAESRYVSGYVFAVATVALGPPAEPLRWLQKAYDDRDDMLVILKADSPFAELRSDQRVKQLLRQIGLD